MTERLLGYFFGLLGSILMDTKIETNKPTEAKVSTMLTMLGKLYVTMEWAERFMIIGTHPPNATIGASIASVT